ncbi:MAG: GNAT family N-acetyltransferase [Thaumarchaeota archaeon]|nr:GNAT family N-acetyltransferase [Nitrososphaerota archaeon]
MSTSQAIREANLNDLEAVQEIENRSFDDPYSMDLFVEFLESFPEGFRVCVIGEKIVGYCITYPLKQKRALVIVSIATHPDFRKLGIASRLLRDSISISLKFHATLNFDKLILQVAEDNKVGQSLYSKFGFENRSTIKNYYGRRKHGLEMELDLNKFAG